MANDSVYYRVRVEAIQCLLRKKELKRWWVAEQAGVNKTTLRRWLTGTTGRVRSEHLSRLASVIEVPLHEIGEIVVDNAPSLAPAGWNP